MAKNRTYAKRQLYVELCRHALEVLDRESFEAELLPSLLLFTKDPVSNVRLPLARIIKEALLPHPEFASNTSILKAMETLSNDPEDIEVVRFFADGPKELLEWCSRQARRKELETTTPDDASHVGAPVVADQTDATAAPAEATPANMSEDPTSAAAPAT